VAAIPRAREPSYPGLATRAVAFAADAALINAAAVLVAAVVVLGLSMLRVPEEAEKVVAAVGAALYALWTVAYFVVFWSATGETPGNRVLGIRVRDAGGGERVPLRRAVLRFAGLLLAALPLLAGFLLILVDDRRRALQDMLAGTVVVDAPERPRHRPLRAERVSPAGAPSASRTPAR
jgi:uncharacterized RDD family membrane protein YckC